MHWGWEWGRVVRQGVQGVSCSWGEAGRARGRGHGLTWHPWGLRTSKLLESPSVPCFFPLLLVWDEILFLFYMNVQRGAHKWDKCVWEYLGGGNQPQILFLLCVLSKSCFLLQALNCMVLVSDFRKKRRKGERKVLVLQMPKGIRGEKTRGKKGN